MSKIPAGFEPDTGYYPISITPSNRVKEIEQIKKEVKEIAQEFGLGFELTIEETQIVVHYHKLAKVLPIA